MYFPENTEDSQRSPHLGSTSTPNAISTADTPGKPQSTSGTGYDDNSHPGVSLSNQFDKQYARSHSGLLKIAEMVLSIIILISLGSTACPNCYQRGYLYGYTIWTFVWTVFMFVIFAFAVYTKIPMVNWILTDLIFSAIDALLFLIASIAAATYRDGEAGGEVGAAFGFFAAIAYGASTWLAYKTYLADTTARRTYAEQHRMSINHVRVEHHYRIVHVQIY